MRLGQTEKLSIEKPEKTPSPPILFELTSLATRKKNRQSPLRAMQPLIASYGNVQVLNHPEQGCPTAPFGQPPILWCFSRFQWEFLPPQVQSDHRNWKRPSWRLNPPCRSHPSRPPLYTSELESRVQGFPLFFQSGTWHLSIWRVMCQGQALGRRCRDYLCSTDQDRRWHKLAWSHSGLCCRSYTPFITALPWDDTGFSKAWA